MISTKRAAAAVVGALLAVVGSVLIAPAASAADTCSGSQVASMNSYRPGDHTLIAITRAYRGSGQICVIAVKQGPIYNTPTRMNLTLSKVGAANKSDSGTFLYQAGPLRTTDNGCIHFETDLWGTGGGELAQDFYYPGINC